MNQAPAPAQAARLILAEVNILSSEQVPLRAATGRVLRQGIVAERDNPPFDRVCMDGAALASAAVAAGRRSFRIGGVQAAGAPANALPAADAALEAMTGAVVPAGADCIVPLEEYDIAAGVLTLHAAARIEPGRNIQGRGTDCRRGSPMLGPGVRLSAAEIAVVASAGLAQVEVARQPRVVVLSSGDELIDPGLPIAGHQVRRSNAFAVVAALQQHGLASAHDAHLRDEVSMMRERLGALLADHDVLVMSGGMSKGRFDFGPTVLRDLGVRQVLHHVAQRPGHPLWFGVGPAGQLVFGLPGNPVATQICMRRYVLPAIEAATGLHAQPPERLALAAAQGMRKLTSLVPVVMGRGAQAGTAIVRASSGSGDFLALAGTDGFIELPPGDAPLPAGHVADFYRW